MFLTRLSSILLFITNITNKIDWGGALVFERNPPHLKYCGNFDLALCFSHGISLSNQKYPLIQCYRNSSRHTRLSIQNSFHGQTSICKSISRMIVKLNIIFMVKRKIILTSQDTSKIWFIYSHAIIVRLTKENILAAFFNRRLCLLFYGCLG